ncbi:MAG: Gfo/Idh/MocA family oxidoreductase [Planctomycetes bacterium]|nr:Gfo/Idh/MocA family oxidoreductase [Planctomycetota bacterium]
MMKIALIGYGYWGPNLLRVLMENRLADEVYCCEMDSKRLEKARNRYPPVKATSKLDDILKNDSINAAIVATPIGTHFNIASKLLESGKSVFVEKPMAASVKEAENLIKLSKKHNKTLMVGHTFEYSPPVLKIKEIISKGELGNIFFISSKRVNLGLHQKDASVIWDLAPHDFSIIFSILGESPNRIQAVGRDCVKSKYPDVAFISLRFPSGVIAHMELSWLAPSKLRNTTIVGSKKMLVYDDTQPVEKIKIFDHGVNFKDPETFGEYQLSYRTGDIVSPKVETFEPLGAEISHFIDCVKTGKKPKTDGESGLRVVKALETAEKSLQLNGIPQDIK